MLKLEYALCSPPNEVKAILEGPFTRGVAAHIELADTAGGIYSPAYFLAPPTHTPARRPKNSESAQHVTGEHRAHWEADPKYTFTNQ